MIILIIYRLLTVFTLWESIFGREIDNGLLGPPVVDCRDTEVKLRFQTEKPFSGRIYVKGLSGVRDCSRDFPVSRGSTQINMTIQSGSCNMRRERFFGVQAPFEGLSFSLVIVVSFHPVFVTKVDRAFRCVCFFRNIKRVTNFLDVSMIGTTELIDTFPMPTCQYGIRSGSPNGPLIRYAKIGDKIYHTWTCEDTRYNMLVHSCVVSDGFQGGRRISVTNIDGCPIDPVIQGEIQYQEAGNTLLAYVETHGYKFSNSTALDFSCVIELCKKVDGSCSGIFPPVCGNLAGGKRRRRKASQVPEVEFDIATDVSVIDSLSPEADKGIPGITRHFVDELNKIPHRLDVDQSETDIVCVSELKITIIIAVGAALFLSLTAISTAVVLYNSEPIRKKWLRKMAR